MSRRRSISRSSRPVRLPGRRTGSGRSSRRGFPGSRAAPSSHRRTGGRPGESEARSRHREAVVAGVARVPSLGGVVVHEPATAEGKHPGRGLRCRLLPRRRVGERRRTKGRTGVRAVPAGRGPACVHQHLDVIPKGGTGGEGVVGVACPHDVRITCISRDPEGTRRGHRDHGRRRRRHDRTGRTHGRHHSAVTDASKVKPLPTLLILSPPTWPPAPAKSRPTRAMGESIGLSVSASAGTDGVPELHNDVHLSRPGQDPSLVASIDAQ